MSSYRAKHSVTYVDFVSKGTVDEHIVKSLRAKIDLSAKTLGEEARQWLELSPKGWVMANRRKKVGDGPDTNIAIGKRSELIAASYFISKGCHVYYQVMEQGPVDLVVLDKSGEWHYFDIKTVSRRKDESIISRTLTMIFRDR